MEAGFRIEAKSTTADSMRLERGWLAKISQEARRQGQVPALTVSFVDQQGRLAAKQDAEWVMIPLSCFKEMAK
jgi:hypothetical protein